MAKTAAEKTVAKKATPAKGTAKPTAKAAPKPAAKTVVKSVVKAAAKVAAKPAAKVAAKPVAKKPSATKTVTKATAKPAATKPAAAKVATKVVAKVVTKPAATKLATKTVAKKPAPKAVAKPIAKPIVKATIKASTKPATKVAAKPTATPVVKKATPPKSEAKAPAKVPAKAPTKVAVTTKKPAPAAPKRAEAPRNIPTAPAAPKRAATRIKPLDGSVLTEAQLLKMPEKDYMNAKQLGFFKALLTSMKDEILLNARETGEHLKENESFADPNDRATVEEENMLEQRVRDRERKLMKKIDQSLARIEEGEYGYCLETGEPIGLPRLMARPTAELSIEAQEKHERREKLFAD